MVHLLRYFAADSVESVRSKAIAAHPDTKWMLQIIYPGKYHQDAEGSQEA